MKEGRTSRTADIAAICRATETNKPKDERVCYDPFAKDFLSSRIYSYIDKNRLITKAFHWYADRMGPGALGTIVGRTRYIDDRLQSCIDDSLKQLVILGAGYDSRAYRFEELRGKVKVFEVDHPITQKMKMEKVNKMLGSLPDHVVYVPIDFEKEKLNERLFESGYNMNLKTLFIWEAVTMYLTVEAVDETLDFIARNSGEGSSIIFDYMFKSWVEGTYEYEDAEEGKRVERGRRNVERTGEPYIFGIEEGTVKEFLSKRGFSQVENVTGDLLKSMYFKGANQNRKVQRFHGYVHATVKPKE
jgi:methyltransferase (TIGR00027 family)